MDPASRRENTKHLQIEEIVQDWIRARSQGTKVSADSVEHANPHLMPELGERFRRLKAIEQAAKKTLAEDDAPCAPDDLTDVKFLRRVLKGYDILERIDYGGQGAVYRATQVATQRVVALKVLIDGPLAGPRQRQRFAREVQLIARLNHPSVVAVFESDAVEGRPYLAMEYVDGISIDDHVLLKQLSVRDIVALFRKVCLGVSAAHQHGIIHRDLKPANILVDGAGEPHILDFGLAKDLAADERLSLTGQVVGTLPYLSPEQAEGHDDKVNACSDIYALGVILYELLTSTFPYPITPDRAAVVHHITQTDPARMRLPAGSSQSNMLVSDDLERVVRKALSKEPARRYQSADAFAADLERYLAGDAVEAKAASSLYVLRKTVRRYRTLVISGSVALVLVVASLIITTILWQRAERIARQAQVGYQMASLLELGAVERLDSRLENAEEAFQQAIEMAAQIQDPDDNVLANLCSAHDRLGMMYLSSDRQELTRPQFESAMSIAKERHSHDPSDFRWKRLLGLHYRQMGVLYLAEEKWPEALVEMTRSIQLRSELLLGDPDNESLHTDLALSWLGLSKCQRRLKEFEPALANLRRAHEWYEERCSRYPYDPETVISMAQVEGEFAVVELSFKESAHDAQAKPWLDRAKQRLEALRDSGRARGYQWDLETTMKSIEGNLMLHAKRALRSNQDPWPSGISTGSSSPSSSGS